MESWFKIKVRAILVNDVNDDKAVTILGTIVRWKSWGLECEADPCAIGTAWQGGITMMVMGRPGTVAEPLSGKYPYHMFLYAGKIESKNGRKSGQN